MVDLTSVFQVRLKKTIRELIKEDADALYAFKGGGFGGEVGVVTRNNDMYGRLCDKRREGLS